MFFRRQLCPFRNREQNFKLEPSYFATCVQGLYGKDYLVSSWHSFRQPCRGPSATPRNLRVCKWPVVFLLQANNCTKQAWGWTVWRTWIQIRENHYLFFVVVISYECILKCVPFYIIYALKFPSSSFPLSRKQPSFAWFSIIWERWDHSMFPRTSVTISLLLQGSSLLAYSAKRELKFSHGKLSFDVLCYQTFWEVWSPAQL